MNHYQITPGRRVTFEPHHLVGIFFTQTPPLPEKECGGLLGGVSVIVSQNVRVGLQEEANIRMANAVADHLGVYSALSAPVA
jgi:hypothetical protein